MIKRHLIVFSMFCSNLSDRTNQTSNLNPIVWLPIKLLRMMDVQIKNEPEETLIRLV